jgi:hypothetical protein
VSGGPEGTRTAYFGFGSVLPFGASWGAPFPPKDTCEPPPPSPSPTFCNPVFGCPSPSAPPEPSSSAKAKPRTRPLPRRPSPWRSGGPRYRPIRERRWSRRLRPRLARPHGPPERGGG